MRSLVVSAGQHLLKGLPFTYQIKGYEMLISRKEKSLTKAIVLVAFHHAVQLQKNGCIMMAQKS